jgi:hypothetical protein
VFSSLQIHGYIKLKILAQAISTSRVRDLEEQASSLAAQLLHQEEVNVQLRTHLSYAEDFVAKVIERGLPLVRFSDAKTRV